MNLCGTCLLCLFIVINDKNGFSSYSLELIMKINEKKSLEWFESGWWSNGVNEKVFEWLLEWRKLIKKYIYLKIIKSYFNS